MSCNLSFGGSGLPFVKDGDKVYICLTESQIMQILCHGLSNHGVGSSGGFYGGVNSQLSGRGVAIGQNAKVEPESEGESIDAIQIGEGVNNKDKTLKIFHWLLLDKFGIIPKERLPELDPAEIIIDPLSTERKARVITAGISVINPQYGKFLVDTTSGHVDLVLPKASEVDGLGFYFRLFKQGVDGYALKVERSHEDFIKVGRSVDDGGYDEWLGITCDVAGTWFYIVSANGSYYLVSESDISNLSNVV